MDRVCNCATAKGARIRGIAVVVTSRGEDGRDQTLFDFVLEDEHAMMTALELASFRLKLDAFNT